LLIQIKVSTPSNETCSLFQKIWQWKLISPKVKMFIWRALHDALPTMHNLHKRMNSISPRCQRCGSEDEYLMHMLFYCFMSRAVWYMSPLWLKVNFLPMVLKDAMLTITQILDHGSIILFCFTLWSLWKARNDYIFDGILSRDEWWPQPLP
jgi:zinc-binding in reverse transcriptase